MAINVDGVTFQTGNTNPAQEQALINLTNNLNKLIFLADYQIQGSDNNKITPQLLKALSFNPIMVDGERRTALSVLMDILTQHGAGDEFYVSPDKLKGFFSKLFDGVNLSKDFDINSYKIMTNLQKIIEDKDSRASITAAGGITTSQVATQPESPTLDPTALDTLFRNNLNFVSASLKSNIATEFKERLAHLSGREEQRVNDRIDLRTAYLEQLLEGPPQKSIISLSDIPKELLQSLVAEGTDAELTQVSQMLDSAGQIELKKAILVNIKERHHLDSGHLGWDELQTESRFRQDVIAQGLGRKSFEDINSSDKYALAKAAFQYHHASEGLGSGVGRLAIVDGLMGSKTIDSMMAHFGEEITDTPNEAIDQLLSQLNAEAIKDDEFFNQLFNLLGVDPNDTAKRDQLKNMLIWLDETYGIFSSSSDLMKFWPPSDELMLAMAQDKATFGNLQYSDVSSAALQKLYDIQHGETGSLFSLARSTMDISSALPDRFLAAAMMAESGGNAKVGVSSAGAVGLMQLMPDTAKEQAGKILRELSAAGKQIPEQLAKYLTEISNGDMTHLADPTVSVFLGTHYFNEIYTELSKKGWDEQKLLSMTAAAYNAGLHGRGVQDGNFSALPAETQNYVRKIMSMVNSGVMNQISEAGLTPEQREAILKNTATSAGNAVTVRSEDEATRVIQQILAQINLSGVLSPEQIKQLACHDGSGWKIDPESIAALAKLQALMPGHRLQINSAYRSPSWNAKQQGAAKDSQHLQGKAFDISMSGINRQEFCDLARQAGFRGFGGYDNFIHIDTGRSRRWGHW